jgi:hypothetical protein
MPDYPRLPEPPIPDPEDTAVHYGCRILYFLLQTSVYCTATDDQLKLAEHAAHVAVTALGILPIAVDRIAAVRREIGATLRRREQLGAASLQDAQPASQAACRATLDGRPDDRTDPSGRVPRRPYPVGPSTGDTIEPIERPELAF